jgi:hypothetical protein
MPATRKMSHSPKHLRDFRFSLVRFAEMLTDLFENVPGLTAACGFVGRSFSRFGERELAR